MIEGVLALGWRGRGLGSIPRAEVEGATVEGSALVVRGGGVTLRLEGLEEPEAGRSALAEEQAPRPAEEEPTP